MEDFRFNTVEELYKKLYPALKTKANDLRRKNINYIKEEDIWNYLRKNYWNKPNKLSLSDMVSDILSTPDYELEDYVSFKFQNKAEEKQNNEIL